MNIPQETLLGSNSVKLVLKLEHCENGFTYFLKIDYVHIIFMFNQYFWAAARIKIV